MMFSMSTLGALALSMLPPSHAAVFPRDGSGSNGTCVTPEAVPALNGTGLRNFGVVLYRAVDMIDVFGPLDMLQLMAHTTQQMNLHLVAETLDPVTTETSAAAMNGHNSSFWPLLTPTATFADDLDLDVLLVPGGAGMRAPGLEPVVDYLARMYPRVKLFATICTGAGLAAQAGVLDGRLATTNKNAWDTVRAMGPDVSWVSPARYVMDGKTWSSSGVTASLDLTYGLIKTYWGAELADRIASIVEYTPREASDDPFSEHFDIAPTETQICSSAESRRGLSFVR